MRSRPTPRSGARAGARARLRAVPARLRAAAPQSHDLGRRAAAYQCVAVTSRFGQGTGQEGVIGIPFRLVADFARGRYAFCRVVPAVGPRPPHAPAPGRLPALISTERAHDARRTARGEEGKQRERVPRMSDEQRIERGAGHEHRRDEHEIGVATSQHAGEQPAECRDDPQQVHDADGRAADLVRPAPHADGLATQHRREGRGPPQRIAPQIGAGLRAQRSAVAESRPSEPDGLDHLDAGQLEIAEPPEPRHAPASGGCVGAFQPLRRPVAGQVRADDQGRSGGVAIGTSRPVRSDANATHGAITTSPRAASVGAAVRRLGRRRSTSGHTATAASRRSGRTIAAAPSRAPPVRQRASPSAAAPTSTQHRPSTAARRTARPAVHRRSARTAGRRP